MFFPAGFRPTKILTLVLVLRDKAVLLGKKKRGFGEGYYNGFGGKVEKGETVLQAAHRELTEEAGIVAKELKKRGLLYFVFLEKPHEPWEVHLFTCTEYEGAPVETDEMAPEWFPLDKVPFEKMWADDVLWYPLVFQNAGFRGLFHFVDTHKMTSHTIEHTEDLEGFGPITS
eukprot:comp17649_c0_seq1/m.17420 comp17649_c0_seq1/g.17420  ORF comp17649_c0_seq1/g.17420 comp17649_c0_seq1/m.17420 type:complete len:172 (-) comp17649_c0_seq1:95-610(-)